MPEQQTSFSRRPVAPFSSQVADEALALVRQLRIELEASGSDGRVRLDELHTLLASASPGGRTAASQNLAYGGLAPWQLRAVERRIDQAMATRLHLEDLALEARLSPRHFGRAFKRATGLCPHAFLILKRLGRACTLMVETEDSLADIASACGLSDQAHLTRLFRQHFQQTPKRWRRLQRTAGSTPNAMSPGQAEARRPRPVREFHAVG